MVAMTSKKMNVRMQMAQLSMPMLVRMKQAIAPVRPAGSRSAKPMKDAMRQPRQIHRPKEYEHQTHCHLHRETQSRRNHNAEGDDRNTHDHDRDGVADAPDCPDEGRAADASMARDNRADRHHMIRVAGVPHTEHESERDYR
jgi:hypothetical protein